MWGQSDAASVVWYTYNSLQGISQLWLTLSLGHLFVWLTTVKGGHASNKANHIVVKCSANQCSYVQGLHRTTLACQLVATWRYVCLLVQTVELYTFGKYVWELRHPAQAHMFCMANCYNFMTFWDLTCSHTRLNSVMLVVSHLEIVSFGLNGVFKWSFLTCQSGKVNPYMVPVLFIYIIICWNTDCIVYES